MSNKLNIEIGETVNVSTGHRSTLLGRMIVDACSKGDTFIMAGRSAGCYNSIHSGMMHGMGRTGTGKELAQYISELQDTTNTYLKILQDMEKVQLFNSPKYMDYRKFAGTVSYSQSDIYLLPYDSTPKTCRVHMSSKRAYLVDRTVTELSVTFDGEGFQLATVRPEAAGTVVTVVTESGIVGQIYLEGEPKSHIELLKCNAVLQNINNENWDIVALSPVRKNWNKDYDIE